MKTLAELLDQRVRQDPHRIAFTFEAARSEASPEGPQPICWTYQQLQRRARAVAAQLVQRVGPGERALLVYPPGLDFIAGFFGCVYAGVLPVPATYPKPRRPLPRAGAIASDCQPSLVLTHSSVLEGLNLEAQASVLQHIQWQATDQLPENGAADFDPVQRATDDLAFLQYTSGSTSEPRGVMVSHHNILHNLESIRRGFQLAEAGTTAHIPQGVFWLPAYHDMGLIGGILTPIYAGGTSHLLAPMAFLRHPGRWLERLSETGAEISGGPNFGYELAAQNTSVDQRAGLDLQHWRLAFCGAEPIHAATLEDFARALEPTGFRRSAFYPCYGLAEVTLLVTGSQGPTEPKVLHLDRTQLAAHRAVPVPEPQAQSQTVVGCGSSLNGQQLLVVDPQSSNVLADGHVGEIWVRGSSVARGYWNCDALNEETFRATLDAQSDQHFLRTGDLGFRLDGELFVTGRLKDVIIIRGRNHYPQDMERTAGQAHAAVDQGAAFSVPGAREEELVVVHQVRRQFRRADLDEVVRAIRTAIVAEHEVDPSQIVLIRPASLPVTSSGKVQRNRCRELFLAGQLTVLTAWTAPREAAATDDGTAESASPPAFVAAAASMPVDELTTQVESWLIAWLTARAHLQPGAMQPQTPFAELGIDSLTAVEISQEMDQLLGLQLPPMVIWSCPHAAELSAYLAEQLRSPDSPPSGRQGAATGS